MGSWRSWGAHFHGMEGVESSSLSGSTKFVSESKWTALNPDWTKFGDVA